MPPRMLPQAKFPSAVMGDDRATIGGIHRGRQFFQSVSDLRKVSTASCKPAANESNTI
jgi:hypothetical protein